MDIELLKSFLLWCSIINISLLSIWFLLFAMAKDFVYKTHTRWYNIPKEKFDSIHYSAMVYWKLSIYLFNIVPYIALVIIT